MNKKCSVLLLATAATLTGIAAEESMYDKIWNIPVLYENKEAAAIQKFALVGRLQADAHSFHENDLNLNNDDLVWRRFRFGFKTSVFQDFTIHSEMDLDMNEADSGNWDLFYNRLTDSSIDWSPEDSISVILGKQSAGFTLDGATSSKKLLVPERSVVGENIWFPTEYFTGAQLSGHADKLLYKAGLFSASGEPEFGHFENGWFTLLSAGMSIGEDASLRLDYVYNDPDYTGDYNVGTKNHEHVAALVYKNKFGENIGIWSDIALTKGISEGAIDQSDLLGWDLMPFYDFSDSFQLVLQYAGVTSLDNQADVSMSRYAYRNTGKTKVTETHNLLLGFNWYLYGHKLKWQNAVEYNYGKDLAGTGPDYNGYGLTSALRISW